MLQRIIELLKPDVSPDAKITGIGIFVGKQLDKHKTRLDTLEIKTLIPLKDGRDGTDGKIGPRGLDGRSGKDGADGKDGRDGKDGAPGKDGKKGAKGISVVDAEIAADDHLVLKLSDGNLVDAGELPSVDNGKIQHLISTQLQNNPLPTGGTTGQVLEKTSNTDYDVQWATPDAAVGGAGSVPVGGIIMWSGTIATIPTPDWQLCDGTANAPGPDLRDKFVVGAKQDDLGVAKSNILGSLSQTGGVTGHSHSAHAQLSHAGFSINDHTGLTHGLSIGNHPDLTHVAIGTHPAFSLPSLSHANVTLPAHTGTAAGLSHAVLTIDGATHGSVAIASMTGSVPGAAHAVLTIEGQTHGTINIPSGTASVPGLTHEVLTIAGATHNVLTMPGLAHAAYTGISLSISSAGTARTIPTIAATNATPASHATYTANGPASHPTFTNNSPASHPTHVASYTSVTVNGPASHPTFTASAPASHPTSVLSIASQTIAGPASHPTFTNAAPASHPTHEVSIASATVGVNAHASYTFDPGYTHPDVGTHAGTSYGVHSFTAPEAHGTAGTVAHSFTESSAHTISAHDTVTNVPSFFALAFIQRML